MFAVVNGYPCTSSCDVAVARRNIDPRNPHNDPVKAQQLAEADLLKGKTPRGTTAGIAEGEKASGPRRDPERLLDILV